MRELLDRGERIMGFGHRVYRAYDPRARVLKRTAIELGSPRVDVAAALEEAALKVLREKSPDRQLETNVEYWAAVVLDVAEIPADLDAGHVRLRAGRRLVGARARAEAHRPADPAGSPVHRARRADARRPMSDLADAAAAADALAGEGKERELVAAPRAVGRRARGRGARRRLPRAGGRLSRDRAVPLPARRSSCCGAGVEDDSPAVRGSALLSLEQLSRDHPGVVNDMRPLLHEMLTHDGNEAVRRLAVVVLRNGSARPDTIQILASLGADDEQPRELRDAATKVAQALRLKSR